MEAPVPLDHEIAAWRLACEHRVPFAFRGLGRSMLPALRPGDEALFEPLAGPPRAGDVLLYRAGDRLVAHRFVALSDDGDGHLRLRGDLLAAEDPPVPRAAVLGRLVAVRRGGRTLPADRGRLAAYGRILPALDRRAPRAARLWRLAVRLTLRAMGG
jgi:hypothetical protein